MTELPFQAPEKVQHDRYGRYLLPVPGDPTGKKRPHTRVTTFAKSLTDTFALSLWSQRMAVKGLSLRPDYYALAKSLSITDRDALDSLVEKCKEAAEADSGRTYGTALHSFVQAYHATGENTAPPPWDKDIEAYAATLQDVGIQSIPGMDERVVRNSTYEVAGRFDKLVTMGDKTYVFDLKTGKDLSYGWGEIEIQLALYADSSHIWDEDQERYTRMPDVEKTWGIVAHLPQGKAKCDLYWVDIRRGLQSAQLCSRVRAWRREKTDTRPLMRPYQGTDDSRPIAPRRHRKAESRTPWEARLATATDRKELSAIWEEARLLGEWTPELQAIGLRRKEELQA